MADLKDKEEKKVFLDVIRAVMKKKSLCTFNDVTNAAEFFTSRRYGCYNVTGRVSTPKSGTFASLVCAMFQQLVVRASKQTTNETMVVCCVSRDEAINFLKHNMLFAKVPIIPDRMVRIKINKYTVKVEHKDAGSILVRFVHPTKKVDESAEFVLIHNDALKQIHKGALCSYVTRLFWFKGVPAEETPSALFCFTQEYVIPRKINVAITKKDQSQPPDSIISDVGHEKGIEPTDEMTDDVT